MAGTMDFIDDAVESLEKDGSQYSLIVGRAGFNRTDVITCVNDEKNAKSMVFSLIDVFSRKFPSAGFDPSPWSE